MLRRLVWSLALLLASAILLNFFIHIPDQATIGILLIITGIFYLIHMLTRKRD